MAVSIDLAGRRALVCGASSGIGRACALEFARAGAEVIVLARNAETLGSLCEELRREGAPVAHALAADMDHLLEFARAIQDLVAQFEGVHICVHNTGGPASGPILEKTEEDLVHVFSRHQLTAHFLVRAFAPYMEAQGYGRFVNVLSTSAREPIENLGLSNVVRAGMVGWAKTVANELPAGVTINNVLPGYTATERLTELKTAISARTGATAAQVEAGWVSGIPEGRLGRPQEIAQAVLFLASPLASYIRGHSLPVEGGRLKGL
jgi:3-oxoacyl-[acyl-carrier protein] reductase